MKDTEDEAFVTLGVKRNAVLGTRSTFSRLAVSIVAVAVIPGRRNISLLGTSRYPVYVTTLDEADVVAPYATLLSDASNVRFG